MDDIYPRQAQKATAPLALLGPPPPAMAVQQLLTLNTCSRVGMKTIQIFSDHIRDQIRLERFRSVRIRVRIFNIRYLSISEYLNRIFMMSISNHILSDMINIICIRIRIRPEIWKQIWYRWYPFVSDPFSSLPVKSEDVLVSARDDSAYASPDPN